MFRLAYLATPSRVPSVPHFPHLKENNVRDKALSLPEQFARLVAHCKDLWLRAMLETAYVFGWRVSELLNLRVGQVDLVARTIRLDPGTTKNREGREVTIESGALLQLLRHCVEGKRPEDHVFTRGIKPIRDFRKSWKNLCTAAGVPALLFHDLRRSAARNLRAAGVPEEVIMRIAGWKTSSVFKRYAIVDQRDIRAALQQLERTRQNIELEERSSGLRIAHLSPSLRSLSVWLLRLNPLPPRRHLLVMDECCHPGRSRFVSNLPLDDKAPAASILFTEELLTVRRPTPHNSVSWLMGRGKEHPT